jgi:hypothetical protein
MYNIFTRTTLAVMLGVCFAGAQAGSHVNAQPRTAPPQRGAFIVEDNALIEATLDRMLHTKRVRSGDRFTATVTGPSEFRGARLYGVVRDAERSGRVNDDAEMTLEFDRIRLRNGRSYRFAGTIERVRTPDRSSDVEVGDEGEIKQENSQTDRTIKRTGLGAIAGAIIGGIAGGGDGAVAGAAIGGGAGVGSVAIQGRQDVELPAGTRFVIRSSAPR